jgi:hypothetical protein
MATCVRCGCTVSIWHKDITSGLCPQCRMKLGEKPLVPAQFIDSFTLKRKRRKFALTVYIGLLILALVVDFFLGNWTSEKPKPVISGLVFFAGILALVAWDQANWTCPACDRWLPRKLDPEFCPYCGARLQQTEETTEGRPDMAGDTNIRPQPGSADECTDE